MKKYNYLLLVLLMGLFSSTTVFATSQDELSTWTREQIGKRHEGDFGAQCVDLVSAYIEHFWGMKTMGNAIEYTSNELPTQLVRVEGKAVAGDIVVQKSNTVYGHVAIVVATDDENVTVVEQNYYHADLQNGSAGSERTIPWQEFEADKVTLIREVGWKKDTTGYWYQKADGTFATGEWIKDNEEWYRIDSQGYLMTNKWFKDSKAAYELDQEGRIKRMVKKITRVNN